jgi:hypothetical protein
MYRVMFITHWEHAIERGDVLVCASDHDGAQASVLHELKLPTSRTHMEVTRVKPSLFVLNKEQQAKDEHKNRAQPVSNRGPIETHKFHFQVTGDVRAPDERTALKRFAESVSNKTNANGTGKHTSGLIIDCTDATEQYRRRP